MRRIGNDVAELIEHSAQGAAFSSRPPRTCCIATAILPTFRRQTTLWSDPIKVAEFFELHLTEEETAEGVYYPG